MDIVRSFLSDTKVIAFKKINNFDFKITKNDLEFDPFYRFTNEYMKTIRDTTDGLQALITTPKCIFAQFQVENKTHILTMKSGKILHVFVGKEDIRNKEVLYFLFSDAFKRLNIQIPVTSINTLHVEVTDLSSNECLSLSTMMAIGRLTGKTSEHLRKRIAKFDDVQEAIRCYIADPRKFFSGRISRKKKQ